MDHDTNSADLRELLVPYAAREMKAVEVSDRVNSWRNDDTACIAPATPARSLVGKLTVGRGWSYLGRNRRRVKKSTTVRRTPAPIITPLLVNAPTKKSAVETRNRATKIQYSLKIDVPTRILTDAKVARTHPSNPTRRK